MSQQPEQNPFDLEKLADQEVYKEYPATTHNWYDKQREGFFNGFIKGYRQASQQTTSLQKQLKELQDEFTMRVNYYENKIERMINSNAEHTESLQKQVEELREENERIRKILRDMLEVDKEYRSRKVNMPMWVKPMIELALNPQDNQKEK